MRDTIKLSPILTQIQSLLITNDVLSLDVIFLAVNYPPPMDSMDVIRRRKRTTIPSAAPTNLHNHDVSQDASTLVDAPVDTVVERASGRRVYRTVTALEAPSPLKRARTNQSAGQSRLLDALDLARVEVDERYEMFGDDPLPPVPPKAPRKGRGLTEPSVCVCAFLFWETVDTFS